MSAGKGGPDQPHKDVTDKAQQAAGPVSAPRRLLARIAVAIAPMREKASSSSLAAWVEARIPPAWRTPRQLILMAVLLLAIVLIIVTRATAFQPHPAPIAPLDRRPATMLRCRLTCIPQSPAPVRC